MKTRLITTALLAVALFAGCSKDKSEDLAPATSSTNASITRSSFDMSGIYTVVSYKKNGVDYTDDFKGFRLYLYKGYTAETVLLDEHSTGNYKLDGRQLSFNFTGNLQTNIITSRVWGTSFLENRQIKLFDGEGNQTIVLYHNFPTKDSPL
jgi:hypothetical protein